MRKMIVVGMALFFSITNAMNLPLLDGNYIPVYVVSRAKFQEQNVINATSSNKPVIDPALLTTYQLIVQDEPIHDLENEKNKYGSAEKKTTIAYFCLVPTCQKALLKRYRYVHEAWHLNTEPHRCDSCQLAFETKYCLITHCKSKVHRTGFLGSRLSATSDNNGINSLQ